MRARLIILLALVLNAAAVAASDVPLPSGNERYIIVFEREAEKSLSEIRDLVKTIGGEVEHALDGWMVVTAPAAAMPKLLEHPAVKYAQPVRTGPAAALSDLPAPRTMAAPDMPIGSHAAQTWSSGDYAYDGAGNIVSIGTSNAPGTQGYRTYGYDKVSRLTRATIGAGSAPPTHEYEYDAYGNRTRYALNNTWVTVPVDDDDNRLTDAGYDAAGNETTRGATAATYDGFGMMTSYRFDANNAETFVYTANDERIGVLRGTEWTWSLRDAGGRVLRQYRSSSTSTSAPWLWVEDFVYRSGLLLGSERVAEEGGRRHYHLDHLGTPRLVTGASGSLMSEHDLLPFGEERTMIGQHLARGFDREEPHRFTGHERDFDTSTPNDSSAYIDYMHARYYVARTGRFLSPDPLLGNLLQPQSWNRYAYVLNNPVTFIDPSGLAAESTPSGETITVEGEDPDRERARRLQLEIFVAFLKSISSYNYAKGAYTYGRGIYRATVHQSRLDGYWGDAETLAAQEEDRKLQEIHSLLARCSQNAQCRERLARVLATANRAIPAHKRIEMQQVAAGRLVTGVGVGYLSSKVGMVFNGPLFAFIAATGDERHYMRTAQPTIDAVAGLLRSIATGGH